MVHSELGYRPRETPQRTLENMIRLLPPGPLRTVICSPGAPKRYQLQNLKVGLNVAWLTVYWYKGGVKGLEHFEYIRLCQIPNEMHVVKYFWLQLPCFGRDRTRVHNEAVFVTCAIGRSATVEERNASCYRRGRYL